MPMEKQSAVKLTQTQRRTLAEVASRYFGMNNDDMPTRTREILIEKGLIIQARCIGSTASDPTFCMITEAGRAALSRATSPAGAE